VRLTLAEQFSSVEELLTGVGRNAPAAEAASPNAALKKNDEQPLTPAPAPALKSEISNLKSQIDDDDDLPRPGKVWDDSGPSLAELMKQQESTEPISNPVSNVEPVVSTDLPATWQRLLDILSQKGPGIPSILSHGELKSIDGGKVVIKFSSATFAAMLDRNGKKEVIRDELSKLLEQPVGVAIEVSEDEQSAAVPVVSRSVAPMPAPSRAPSRPAPQPVMQSTPASTGIRITPELKEELRGKNPLINAIMTELGGEIVKVE
jgi:hypothetical protein